MDRLVEREGIKLPHELRDRLIEYSERNVRKAILALEATKCKKYPFSEGQCIEKSDWEEFIDALTLFIIQEQSPARLLACREKLYELLTHCIPGTVILKRLTLGILGNVEASIKPIIMREASFYEHRLTHGTKAIFHLEAFVAKIMSIYKKYLMELTA